MIVGCSVDKNKFSEISENKKYGFLNYSFKDEDFFDVSNLMINQSISSFIISSVFRGLTIKVLNRINSLSDLNKEKHLKAIYVAVNYLEVGKSSTWTDKSQKVIGKVKVLRRFNLKKNQCVTYKEIIKNKNKKNIDYITACNIENEWKIQNV